jgi:hypothetical protein
VQLGPVIPDSSWAVLRISGTVSYTINPDCQNSPYVYLTACGDLDGKQTGEWFYNGSSHVDLATVPPGTAPHLPIAMFTDDTDADAGISLVRNTSGGPWNVYAYRHISHHGIFSTLTGFGPAGNFLGGRQTVRVTRIPSPLVLTGPDAVAPGDSAGFDVRPFDGLRFYDPNQFDPAQAWVSWDFFPGDTGGVHRDGWTEDTGCSGVLRTHCSFTPREAGRLFVSAYVMGRWVVEERVVSVGEQQASRLEVKCTPLSVLRGSSVVCEADAKPHGDLTVTGWWFDDGNGHIIRPDDPQQDSAFYWGGPIVVSGTVHAQGLIDSRAVPPDSARIVVQPRPWSFTYPAEPSAIWDRGDSLPYPPVVTYGQEIGDGVLGRFYGGSLEWKSVLISGHGPNHGLSYMLGMPVVATPLLILINAGLRPEDPWYQAQVGPTQNHPHGCGVAFLQREGPHVPVHESGHYRVAQQFWNAPATSSAMESPVDFAGTTAAMEARMDSLEKALDALQAHFDSTDYGIQDCDPYPLPRR